MFKIDKSSVDYMDYYMSMLVVQDKLQVDPNKETPAAHEPVHRAQLDEEVTQQIRLEAEKQAEEILRESREKSEDVRQAAWRKGYEEGIEAGRQAYQTLKKQENELLDAITQKFEAFESTLCQQMEDAVLQLSVDIAKKIVNSEIERNNQD